MIKTIFTLAVAFPLLFTNLLAQSPGGVNGSGTNQLWLDAAQLNLSNGALVSSWTDFSGNGNTATSITSSNRPTYSTNQINGRASLVFDGTSDFLRTPSIAALNTGNISYFIVFEADLQTNVGVLLGGKYNDHNQFLMSYAGGTNIRSWVIRLPNTTKEAITTKSSGYQSISTVWSSTTGIVNLRKDGTLFGSATGATSVPSGHNYLSIGANPASNSYKLKGGIAEIIMYSSTLNSAERIIIENYLAAKYGLATANDFYAYESTHSYDLTGIGQEADGANAAAVGLSTLQLNNMSSPSNGDYVMIGHDGVALTNMNSTDVPSVGWARYERVWRAGITGAPGTVDVVFDVSQFSVGAPNSHILLVDNDGVFATGATQYIGVYNAVAETVTFSGVTLNDGDFIGLANTAVSIISTGVTTDWHTPTTWNCACVPTINSQVTVLAGHTVNVNGQNAFASNLTIDGTLTFSSTDTLTLAQNIVNNGTVTLGTAALKLESTVSAQTIDGNFAFHHLIVDNPFGVQYTSGTATVQGFLNVQNGTFSTNNAVTMLSNATGSGMLRNPLAGSIIGDLTVQRFLNEGESWYLLASPLTDGTLEDWNNEFEMQGFAGTEWPGAPYGSVYYFDETATGPTRSEGYILPSSTSDITTNTVGWQAYVGNDSYGAVPKIIDATGTPRLGSGIVINGTYTTNIGNPSSDGWNLVGNPYQSPVRYVNVTKGGNYDVAYRKKASGASQAINNLDIISPGEGFWLHCLGGPCSLTFDAVDVVDAADVYNLRVAQQNDKMIVKLNYANNEYDDVLIAFDETATNGYDLGKDGYKLDNTYPYKPNLAIVNQENHHQHIGVFNKEFNSTIPLNVYTENPSHELKNYSLVFENVSILLENNKRVVVEDRLLNTFTPLAEGLEINFQMMDTVKAPRFFLHVSTPLEIQASDVTCFGKNNGEIKVSLLDNQIADIVCYDENEQVVYTRNNVSTTQHIANLKPGTYKVKATDNIGEIIDVITIKEPKELAVEFTASSGDINNGAQSYTSSTNNDTLDVIAGDVVYFESKSSNNDFNSWDFGDLTTSNLISPEHIYFNEGLYKVVLTSSNGKSCSVETAKYVRVKNNSSSENNPLNNLNVVVLENDVLVYMNNELDAKGVSFEVINQLGQTVFVKVRDITTNHIEKINLAVASGVYFVKVKGINYSETKKIVFK